MNKDSKLIIIRGNSGSGKTSTSKSLQKALGHGTMLISQDVIRREMLYVKDGPQNKASNLLISLVQYGMKHCNTVILEGILKADWYKDLFLMIYNDYPNQVYAYYYDIPFSETLSRHVTKVNSHEFGEKEMRSWWNEKDYIGFIKEYILSKELSLNNTVDLIMKHIG